MLATPPALARRREFIRWTARVVGLAATLLWAFVLIANVVEEGFTPLEAEGMILGAFILIAIAGVVIAFFNEDTGGSICLVAGLALGVFALVTAGRNHWLAVLVSGGPFLAAGVLFLVSAHLYKERPPS